MYLNTDVMVIGWKKEGEYKFSSGNANNMSFWDVVDCFIFLFSDEGLLSQYSVIVFCKSDTQCVFSYYSHVTIY